MTNINVKKVDLGNVKGEKGVTGEKGVGILEINPTPIQSTSTSDTFEITYTDGSKGRITFPRKIFETTNNIDNINNTDSYNIIPTVKAIKNLKTSLEDKIYNIKVIEIVTVLPSENIKDNRVYLLYKGVDSNDNLNATFDIYINKTKNSDGWEKLDNLNFKISDYYTKSETDITFAPIEHEHLTSKIKNSQKLDNIGTVANATQFQINKEIDSVVGRLNSHTHGNLTNEGKVGTTNNSNKNVVTDANGNITIEDKELGGIELIATTNNSDEELTATSTTLSEVKTGTMILLKVINPFNTIPANCRLTLTLKNGEVLSRTLIKHPDFDFSLISDKVPPNTIFLMVYNGTVWDIIDQYNLATQSFRGFMSAEDKTKLDNTYTKAEIDALIGNIEEDMSL